MSSSAIASRRLPAALASLAIAGMTACTIAGFLGGAWWVFDVAASFRMYYLVLLAVAAGVAAGLELWRWASAGYLAFAINLAVVAPLYLPGGPAPISDGPRMHVLAFNVHGGNPNGAAIADYIAGEEPDVVIILELRPDMDAELRARLPDYRFATRPQGDNFGIGIATRHAAATMTVRHDELPRYPAVAAVAPLGDQPTSILGLHPPPPVGRRFSGHRDRILELAGSWARDTRGAVIICGDFNATHWSYPFRRLLDEGNLHDAARGRGVLTTWPSGLGPLEIPIDHCVHSAHVAVVERRVGPWLGSDHRPLHVVFAPAR